MTTLGARLKKIRDDRALTQKELAKASGIKQPSLSDIETGETKMPDAETLIGLCETLRIRPAWLVTGRGPIAPVEDPLPEEAHEVARNWMRLAPGIRESIATTIKAAAEQADKLGVPVSDLRVERAYGKRSPPLLLKVTRESAQTVQKPQNRKNTDKP
jgi:transcriptional regulator with XRE-family HTH domain